MSGELLDLICLMYDETEYKKTDLEISSSGNKAIRIGNHMAHGVLGVAELMPYLTSLKT